MSPHDGSTLTSHHLGINYHPGWGDDPADAGDAPELPSALCSCLDVLNQKGCWLDALTAEGHGKPGTHTKRRPSS